MTKTSTVIGFVVAASLAISTLDSVNAAQLRSNRALDENSASMSGDGEDDGALFWDDDIDASVGDESSGSLDTTWDDLTVESASGTTDEAPGVSTEAPTSTEVPVDMSTEAPTSTEAPVDASTEAPTPAPTSGDDTPAGVNQFMVVTGLAQCGGWDFDYSKYAMGAMPGHKLDCAAGYECTSTTMMSLFPTSFCMPIEIVEPVAFNHKCGGIFYTGNTVCAAGSVCTKMNGWTSKCVPVEKISDN